MERAFSMRKKKSVFPKILLILLLTAAISGFLIFTAHNNNEPEATNEPVAMRSEPTLENGAVTKIKTLYKCGHEKNEIKTTDSNLIGKTRREVELLHPEWNITSFTPNEISAETEEKKECGKHFMIRLIGDKLCVYKTDDTNKMLKEKEINLNTLSQTDIEILLNGIRAETEFEMLEILESFSE